MKKFVSILFALLLVLGCVTLSGCGSQNSGTKNDGKLKVICTIFPQYDWVKNIVGEDNENVQLLLLLDSGVDLHNYQPTVTDIAQASNADLFVYVGGESDKWVDDFLESANNPDIEKIALIETVDAVEEEELEGMEAEEEDDGEDEVEYDEHVWLSLKNAKKICKALCDKLCELDPSNAETYRKNCDDYTAKLDELDQRYTNVVSSAKRKDLLFADRFPFRYMAEDYGLNCYAAFSGCSAETEASFTTVTFLSNKLSELDLPYIIIIDGNDGRLADTIIESSTAHPSIAILHSMQSVIQADIDTGTTYLDLMEGNLDVLSAALN